MDARRLFLIVNIDFCFVLHGCVDIRISTQW